MRFQQGGCGRARVIMSVASKIIGSVLRWLGSSKGRGFSSVFVCLFSVLCMCLYRKIGGSFGGKCCYALGKENVNGGGKERESVGE